MIHRHQLRDAETGEVLVARLHVADTFWRRWRGLQLRSPLDPDEGLLLAPCRAIHTHWMRFSLDVAMLDRDGFVLRTIADLRPWRIAPRIAGTAAIVETAAGSLSGRLRTGVRVAVVPVAAPGSAA